MRLEGHFESSSTLQRNERVKLAASFWNNVGAGMVIGGMAGAFFLDKPPGALTKIGIAMTCTWLALLFNRQRHVDLYAYSARRAPLDLLAQPGRAAGRSEKFGIFQHGGESFRDCLTIERATFIG